jgi:hypothetical protein
MVGDGIRILSVAIVGALLMFLVQPWLYQSGIVPITQVEVETWLSEKYTVGAAIVFSTALVATLLWYVSALRAKVTAFNEASPLRLVWGLLLLLPIIGICVALSFYNNSSEALLPLTFMYVVDVVWVYWFTTAISSPGLLKFIPPGSFTVRHLIGLK